MSHGSDRGNGPMHIVVKLYGLPFQRQYVFIHDALLEAIECGDTDVPARDLSEQFRSLCVLEDALQKTKIQLEFEVDGNG